MTVNYGDGSGEQVDVSRISKYKQQHVEDGNVWRLVKETLIRFGLERIRATCGLTSTSCLADIG